MEGIHVEVSESGCQWINTFRDEESFLQNKSDMTDIICQLVMDQQNGFITEKECFDMLNTMISCIHLIESLKKLD